MRLIQDKQLSGTRSNRPYRIVGLRPFCPAKALTSAAQVAHCMDYPWIPQYKKALVQIATPYSTGTGFVLKPWRVIVTNEHVVRDNGEVIVDHPLLDRQLVPVLFVDEWLDLALLSVPRGYEALPELKLDATDEVRPGEPVIAMGHPFGLKFSATEGIISNPDHREDGVRYLQHDAALNPGNSGGPLFNEAGEVIGVNTFILSESDNMGFALPASCLQETLSLYLPHYGEAAARCPSCRNLILAREKTDDYCPRCGATLTLPGEAPAYTPEGVARTVEQLIAEAGHDLRLTRRGPNAWEINQGSARILITYHEQTGMIHCEAALCLLPSEGLDALYAFLLRTNYQLEGLTFSVQGHDIVLSLVLYDRYLDPDTGRKLLRNLFEQADHYDDILVEQFGARWRE